MAQVKVEFPFIKLAPLFEFVRYEPRPSAKRTAGEVWLRLPHGMPIFTTVKLSPLLAGWLQGNMFYKPVSDKFYYLEAREYGEGQVMLSVQYQEILGRRALCVVPLSELKAALGPLPEWLAPAKLEARV
jgi:hypothetical protein